MTVLRNILNSFIFWGAWIIIPFLTEIVPSIGNVLLLLKRRLKRQAPEPEFWPEIVLIIPVYNSADTLGDCIQSIAQSKYPDNCISIFLVNNQSTDDSFQVYTRCQEKYPELHMQWLNARQGKSRALNMALYSSQGKYIIHVDSDGVLEESALTNLVSRFEWDQSVNCMTGAVLTRPEKIEAYPCGISRLLRKIEFVEYARAFLAGRNYASEVDFLYTFSGAFTAFRSSAILNSWLYNTETVSEDTHITFQMRYNRGEKVRLCENALFFVDPIESAEKLYTQRQRWQRGSLEVAKMFAGEKLSIRHALTDTNVHTLLYDHTFAFPRMIWYLALICLLFIGYSGKAVVLAMGVIFLLYIVSGYLYFAAVTICLRGFDDVRRYYMRQWWAVALLPFFNLIIFFVRMAGIINSIDTDSAWKTKGLSEEADAFVNVVKSDFAGVLVRIRNVRGWVNASEAGDAEKMNPQRCGKKNRDNEQKDIGESPTENK